MTMEAKAVAALLRQLADLIDGLGQKEQEAIIGRQAKLVLDRSKQSRASSAIEDSNTTDRYNISEIKEKLDKMESREDAEKLFEKIDMRRSDIQVLAKSLSISVHSSDNATRIRDKIIDSTVGYRLRSRAIRGE